MTLRTHVTGLAHIGIRVHDMARSRAFYRQLGFEHAWGPIGGDNVVAMRHASGLELNFIVNAQESSAPNMLMDIPGKHAGVTHFALRVTDLAAVEAALGTLGIPLSGKRGEAPVQAIFIRDPDRNVIELVAG